MPLDGPGITVRTGKTQLISDVQEDPDFAQGPISGEPGVLSELSVPMIIEGEVIGVINVESERPDAFNVQDQELIETLASRVASAIQILRNREELKRSNHDLEDYTHVVSHDLKAPLRLIAAFSNFLLDDYTETLDETGKEYLKNIIDAAIQMNQLIEDLLVLSRVGRKYTEMELIDLNNMIMTIKAEFRA